MSEIELRELRGDDVFPLLTILGKMDITDEFVRLTQGEYGRDLPTLPVPPLDLVAKQASGDKLSVVEQKQLDDYQVKLSAAEKERTKMIDQRGVEVAALMLKKVLLNATLIKPELNAFLASLTGVTAQKISALMINEYTALLIKLFRKKELMEVFTSAASLLTLTEGPLNSETDSGADTETPQRS